MKKLLLCVAIAAITFLTTNAQDGERIFKKFKGDVSLGYAAPLGNGANGGVLFALEPKFALMDKLAVGLRMEGAVMAQFTRKDYNGNGTADDPKVLSSYIATADYYFTSNYSFRPFAGAGAGIFEIVTDVFNSDQVSDIRFGGIVRVGAELKHFRFAVEYNIVPHTDATFITYDNFGMPQVGQTSLNNSYIGIKAGFCFGGGPL